MKSNVNPVLQFWNIKGGEVGGPCATVGFESSSTQVWHCEGCERIMEKSDLSTVTVHAEGKGAKCWPNFLFGFKLIVSGQVLEDLNANKITGYVPHKVVFHKIDSPKLQKISPPDYYLLELTGYVDIDRQFFDEGEGFICPVCHIWTPKSGGKYGYGSRTLVPLMESWDGSDFLHIRNPSIGYYLCTRQVVELARARNWFKPTIESITPRPFQVNLESEHWFAEIEGKVREEYPQLLVGQ